MPGFDGTGPQGQGPMTGGGFGRCTHTAGYGMRPRFGRGNGQGRRWGTGYAAGTPAAMAPADRKQILDDQITSLMQELEELKQERKNLS